MGWLTVPAKAGGYTLPGDDTARAALGESGLHDLMSLRATGMVGMMKQMPPLGSEITYPTGIGQVDAWINALPSQ